MTRTADIYPMADNSNGKTTTPKASESPKAAPQVQAQVVAQYVKDLSFENPNVQRLLDGPGDSPNMQLEVNVNAKNVGENLFESEIDFSAHATNKEGTIYEMEIVYAGLFKIENIPAEALEPFLLINCPALLFPFLRRLAADVSREGGFPPLMLDPIDFAGLFMRKQQESVAAATGSTATN